MAHDHVFMLGDLNYRVGFSSPGTLEEFESVVKLASCNSFKTLLAGDQLRQEMYYYILHSCMTIICVSNERTTDGNCI